MIIFLIDMLFFYIILASIYRCKVKRLRCVVLFCVFTGGAGTRRDTMLTCRDPRRAPTGMRAREVEPSRLLRSGSGPDLVRAAFKKSRRELEKKREAAQILLPALCLVHWMQMSEHHRFLLGWVCASLRGCVFAAPESEEEVHPLLGLWLSPGTCFGTLIAIFPRS